MARKKPTLIEEPVVVASSEPVVASSSSGEEEESSSSEESGEEGSSSDEVSDEVLSKPTSQQQQTQKKQSATPVLKQDSSLMKRPNETEDGGRESKRAKLKGRLLEEEEVKQPGGGEDVKSKQLFQRLFSEEDEIHLLEGMIEYSANRGVDPMHETQVFHDFIKDSFHVEVTKAQLVDKMKRLKKKFENNFERSAKKGEDPTFSKPHEHKSYFLSQQIWGNVSNNGGVTDEGVKAAVKSGNLMETALKSGNLKEKDKILFDKSLGVAGLEEFVLGEGFDLIAEPKKAELEKKWKHLMAAQMKLFVERSELIKEQTIAILDAMK